MTEGKLVTYGIYFDVNKDVVKPESYGTLKEIATILNEVPDVKVKILGHTDADGADAANLIFQSAVPLQLKMNWLNLLELKVTASKQTVWAKPSRLRRMILRPTKPLTEELNL